MDITNLGHIGAELVLAGGVSYTIIQQRALVTRVQELEKQVEHLALHINTINEELVAKINALVVKSSSSPPARRIRDLLQEDEVVITEPEVAPRPRRNRPRKLPPQEPVTPKAVTPEASEDESDPETVLKQA